MPPKNESINTASLLANLPKIEVEVKQLSARLQELPIETQLLTISEVSIERETDELKQLIDAARQS
jgi:hypothetical protein